ncbi:hypothetical protein SERLA73DRAFT_73386 [Serpula lacrymans var. lacrymans S7.3]|uniref:Secreted protein n=2 Tax=Serpula lacrymans var. lacrymans TaxID=341189 RepID=F8PY27_SERL3|nr:uncharacterized protein SERLADRAFT_437996 [Serpula lacrymans var. lacrymans S7.9]EGN98790.1 hypothetical protein SERLA73DRAFT_73386 [Serpula lacrymans var. lacrymans S7.3]EGO24384.1 hypothetical protein SERLADRAFT_437996 [Serpula lacrymans var. lacrymans S7.9]
MTNPVHSLIALIPLAPSLPLVAHHVPSMSSSSSSSSSLSARRRRRRHRRLRRHPSRPPALADSISITGLARGTHQALPPPISEATTPTRRRHLAIKVTFRMFPRVNVAHSHTAYECMRHSKHST